MKAILDSEKSQALFILLNEARAEADTLRKRLAKAEKILLSTRLIMGHELKRPSTAIGGYIDLAVEELNGSDKEAINLLAKARNECELLNELNGFFLELLREDMPRERLHGRKIDMASFLTRVVSQLPAELDANKRVKTQVAADAREFSLNANAFKIIVANVIENALRYSPKDELVNVTIERTPEKRGLGDGDLLKIQVSDNGIGIHPGNLKKIFDAFVRLDNDSSEGSGLGLTLVRSLVELNGGDISVRSEKDEGTTVYVMLPEIETQSEDDEPE